MDNIYYKHISEYNGEMFIPVKLNVYAVYNGYLADTMVCKIVIADTEEKAEEIAREGYKKEKEESKLYTDDYYKNLKVELLGEVKEGIIFDVE